MKKLSVLLAFSVLILSCKKEDALRLIISQMDTRDKVAQLIVAHHYNPEIYSLVENEHIGGVIVMVSNKAQVDTLIPQLKALSKYPLFTCIDAEWGAQMRLKKDYEALPYACDIKTIEKAYEVGYQIGLQLEELGIDANLAPVCDVNTNPDNPIIGYRAFGDNTKSVSELACAYARGLKAAGKLACAKHYPGHGDTSVDSHKALPTVAHSMERLDTVELAPFKAMIAQGVDMIMIGHLSVPAMDSTLVPSSVSKPIYRYLRENLGYKGCVVTDGLGMKGLVNAFDGDQVKAAVATYEAGADMLLGAYKVREIIDAIYEKVLSGEFSEEELNEKVYRVLELKRDKFLNSAQ